MAAGMENYMEKTEEVVVADKSIESKIVVIRDVQVILDRDLAILYEVDVAQLNRQVKRNINRFPEDFMFQLNKEEADALKCQNGISNRKGGDRYLPYAFTEQGVSMLSGLLRSDVAIKANIMIMRAFVAMRRYFVANAQILQHLKELDRKQLENEKNFERIFAKFEEGEPLRQGIFFDGQTYDAYTFVADRVREAKSRIVLIDNYIDDTVLTMLDKRAAGVEAVIYTGQISKTLRLDIDKHNAQYPAIEVHVFKKAHDRFLIIDDKVYHFGASIKDLGKKWFAVSLMTELIPKELISRM